MRLTGPCTRCRWCPGRRRPAAGVWRAAGLRPIGRETPRGPRSIPGHGSRTCSARTGRAVRRIFDTLPGRSPEGRVAGPLAFGPTTLASRRPSISTMWPCRHATRTSANWPSWSPAAKPTTTWSGTATSDGVEGRCGSQGPRHRAQQSRADRRRQKDAARHSLRPPDVPRQEDGWPPRESGGAVRPAWRDGHGRGHEHAPSADSFRSRWTSTARPADPSSESGHWSSSYYVIVQI